MKTIEGKIVDVVSKTIFEGRITIENGIIKTVEKCNVDSKAYILPGLVDSHIHIESSMLTPQRFALSALRQGVISVVADPHEITNVLGVDGFKFMLNDAEKSPMKIYFGVPSCVPATGFETSGAVIDSKTVAKLLNNSNVVCLSEMMNFPGVINGDSEVLAKIDAAKSVGKPVDGHAPGLNEDQIKKYAAAGITTDHECFDIEDARLKIKYGFKIQIREGSAAKNQDALAPLLKESPDSVMLCSDDYHPDDLNRRYLFSRIQHLVKSGYDFFDVLRAATIVPITHYGLNVGFLQEGNPADLIVVDDIQFFKVRQVYIDGNCIFDNGKYSFDVEGSKPLNKFHCKKISASNLDIPCNGQKIRVIEVVDKELITKQFTIKPLLSGALAVSDVRRDILKITVVNRYDINAKPAVAFIKGFKLKFGAIATCIAHDSHNIVCVGADDKSMVMSINTIVKNRGGLAVCTGSNVFDLPLPIGGIMSNVSCETLAQSYLQLNSLCKALGCNLTAPFMTLSFMALPVIPSLKITDKGLFDVEKFAFVSVTQ